MSMSSGQSSKGRLATLAEISQSMPPTEVTRDFEPCAATPSMFLYVQGNSVVCAHHDTLAIERRFSRHTEEIQLLAVDNISERGAGRLVVTYDAGQTAIVWDCMTGDELARFASYENLTVAAWMRNGNVAFGALNHHQRLYLLFWGGCSFRRRVADLLLCRQFARESDSIRTFNIRTHFRENDRPNPNHGFGSRCRL